MERSVKTYNHFTAIIVFIALPVLIYSISDFPRRSVLKEAISLLVILAFYMMLLQFYLSRINCPMLKSHKMSGVIKWHKALGYIFVSILIFHPFLIVVPRYFEAGITPKEAFIELLSNYDQQGILLGMIAWLLMIVIGLTSLIREKLPFSYRTWRVIHGILSIVFILMASLHVFNLGRHINEYMVWLISILTILGVTMLLRTYIYKSNSKKIKKHVKQNLT